MDMGMGRDMGTISAGGGVMGVMGVVRSVSDTCDHKNNTTSPINKTDGRDDDEVMMLVQESELDDVDNNISHNSHMGR